MHCLTSVYFVNQPRHVSGIFVAHYQAVYYIYIYIYIYIYNNWYVLYIYCISPDDGLPICPKHVEVDCRNKLRINSASSWFFLHRCIEMHGQQNMKYTLSSLPE